MIECQHLHLPVPQLLMFALRHQQTGVFAACETRTDWDGMVYQALLRPGRLYEDVWMLSDREVVEQARLVPANDFESTLESPGHSESWVPEEWEVVSLYISIQVGA